MPLSMFSEMRVLTGSAKEMASLPKKKMMKNCNRMLNSCREFRIGMAKLSLADLQRLWACV